MARHGFLRARDGAITTFDVPDAVNGTYAGGINSAGTIAGNYFDASFFDHGFLRASDGTITEFDVPGAVAFTPRPPGSTRRGPSRDIT